MNEALLHFSNSIGYLLMIGCLGLLLLARLWLDNDDDDDTE